MNYIIKSLVLIAIFFVFGCKVDKQASSESGIPQENTSLITVSKKQFEASGMINGKIEMKQFDKIINVNGKIALPSRSRAVVSSMISGTVGEIDLLKGQWIKNGQALFTVTNPDLIDLQEEYLVLQSKMEYLNEEQVRKQKLVNENLSPKQELLLAQSEFKTNQTKYKTISQKLKLYGVNVNNLSLDHLSSSVTIFSPISGYVSGINALRGQYINPTTEVVEIDNKSNVYLALNVLERDALRVENGQDIRFSISGSSHKYSATIHLINPSVGDNGMVSVHCRIKENKDLIPGMYAVAEMILENYESNALPEDAVVKIEGKNHILIQSSKLGEELKYKPQYIEVGANENGYVALMNNNDWSNKTILVKGGYYLVN